jgi:hypothetical protein
MEHLAFVRLSVERSDTGFPILGFVLYRGMSERPITAARSALAHHYWAAEVDRVKMTV